MMRDNIRKKLAVFLFSIAYNRAYKSLNKINEISKLDEDSIQKYQDEKLKEILIYSYKNVPYYNKVLFEAQVVDGDLNVNLDNFSKIPILTKKILRKQFDNLKSRELNKMNWEYNTSGGSSGEPARFIQDYNYKAWNIANKIFYKISAGASIGGRELRIWGSERDILEGSEDIAIVLRNKFYNRFELNTYRIHMDNIDYYIQIWNKFKPEWVEAYVHIINEFAKYVLENNIKIFSPKGIICTAGTLDVEMRENIEKAFGTKVYNRYGSREVGDMACEDNSSKGLRISSWNHKLEVLDKDLNPTRGLGNLYVTTLNNYAMPLIRYDIGDVVQRGSDPNYLKSVSGRVTSIFKTKDGRFFDGSYLRAIIFNKEWIDKYQIVQKDYDKIEYIFVPRDNKYVLNKRERCEITKNVQKLLGPDCKVIFTFVNEIQGLGDGKYIYTKSEIQ